MPADIVDMREFKQERAYETFYGVFVEEYESPMAAILNMAMVESGIEQESYEEASTWTQL